MSHTRFSKALLTRTSTAIIGSALLLGGLAACSSDEVKENANKATDAAGSVAAEATAKGGSAVNKMTSDNSAEKSADPSAEKSAKNAKDAKSSDENSKMEATTLTEGDVPASVSGAATSWKGADGIDAGTFKSAQKLGDATAVEYENVTFVESPDHGVVPLIGKIRETWQEKGGLANPIGTPTAPEKTIDKGWEQTFTKDTMKWTSEDGQNFSDSYMNQ